MRSFSSFADNPIRTCHGTEGDVLIIEGNDIKIDFTGTLEKRKKVKEMMDRLWE